MSDYCEPDDVAKRIRDVVDAEFSLDNVLEPAIEYAESFIDSYLDGYYKLPFDGGTPEIVKQLTIKLAAADVLNIAYQDKSDEQSAASNVMRDEVIATLKKIQEREMSIPGAVRVG